MPRPNKERTIGAEPRLAIRMSEERESRGWSHQKLAAEMTEAGCPVDQSAIWKTENAGRRITLDEAVAMSRVWNISIERLIS